MITTQNCCICEPSDLMQMAYDKFKRKHNQGQGPTPSAADPWNFLIAPGRRTDSLIADTSYINIGEQYPGTVDMEGTITISSGVSAENTVGQSELSGYSVTGNTLTVTSVGGAGDRFATLQEAYDAVAVDSLLGEPTVSSPKYVRLNGINFEQGRVTIESVADVDGTDSTIITSSVHGLEVGDYVRLVGMSVSSYDSPLVAVYEVKTTPTDTTFTIEMTCSETATGTAIKQAVLATSNDYVGVIVDSNVTNLVVVL